MVEISKGQVATPFSIWKEKTFPSLHIRMVSRNLFPKRWTKTRQTLTVLLQCRIISQWNVLEILWRNSGYTSCKKRFESLTRYTLIMQLAIWIWNESGRSSLLQRSTKQSSSVTCVHVSRRKIFFKHFRAKTRKRSKWRGSHAILTSLSSRLTRGQRSKC